MRTNTLPSAGTQAQVTVTVYGHKTDSGPITLGSGDGRHFQPGNIDEFDVSLSFLACSDFCCLLITFANSLDPDEARQNVGPDLDPTP